jgi:heterodisulfide reductase subunit A-like polyferredoxin/coenzyme F420-reducing hydrogenase delta subunit
MNTTQQNNTEQIDLATDVVVIGGGHIGLKAASQISANGYHVILAACEQNDDIINAILPLGASSADIESIKSLEDDVAADKNIEIIKDATLVDSKGIPGDFTLKFESADQIIEKKAGAVVIATDLAVNPLHHIYGLEASESVVSLSEFEAMMADDVKRKDIADNNKTVAFLVGFAQEGNPLIMKRVLTSVADIAEADGCSAYVYVNNIKVADDGLERLYKKGRDRGAIYFKLTKSPDIVQNNNESTITYYDPVIRNDIELSPDMIVVEDALVADQANSSLAETLRIDQGPAGFLQTENVHRLPIDSNREGIFVIGSSRDVQNLAKSRADIDNMLIRVKQLLGDGSTTVVPAAKAVVDREKCTICLTCYRCCPHGAIYWDDKAIISPLACQACGICASECPMDAIQVGDFSDTAMESQIKEAGAAETNGKPKIVAFCCQNSAYEAGTAAKAFNYDLPDGLEMIKVPCAGKVDIQYILNALVEGADGVLVMACHHGNCKSESGNTYAKWRVNDAYKKLEQVGIEKGRLEFVTLASNMASDFARFVVDMEKRISQKDI